jgi:glycosyltransferase involved in cell wall biosynthesis
VKTAVKSVALRPGEAVAASVVIPAHNEAAVLGRLFDSLPATIGHLPLQVVVACNGCTDETASIARARGATVVEVDTPSKIAALNAGDEAARGFPRIYIDADVVVTPKMITDLVQMLNEPEVACAAPPFRVELTGRPWRVRAYYAIWLRLPYLKDGYVGSGIYALSRAGRARFVRFPNIIADDLFVRNQFSRRERRVVPTEPFTIQAPWTLRSLLRRRVRIDVGNMEFLAHPEYRRLPGSSEMTTKPWWHLVVKNPLLAPAAVIYAGVNFFARLQARKKVRSKGPVDWARDDTTRSAA